MPKVLKYLSTRPPADGVLIKQRYLEEGLRARRLMSDAKHQAARLVKQAQQEVVEYQSQGYTQGYGAGWLEGASALADFFNDKRQLIFEMRKAIEKDVRSLLDSALQRPELVDALMENWVKDHSQDSMQVIEVCIPRAWHQAQQLLGERFKHDARIQIKIYDGPAFIIRQQDKIYEFAPEEASFALQHQVLRRIRQHNLTAQCQQLSADAASRLAQTLTGTLPTATAASTRQSAAPTDSVDFTNEAAETAAYLDEDKNKAAFVTEEGPQNHDRDEDQMAIDERLNKKAEDDMHNDEFDPFSDEDFELPDDDELEDFYFSEDDDEDMDDLDHDEFSDEKEEE